MKKLLGTAAGILILMGTVSPAGPALAAGSAESPRGDLVAGSWDWPK
ncbi:hypothetical protein [uncultured Arthrobacter sp.]|nr:hypothetical protein [uncultured Arthrobacter sp.]